jgi:hypothetical protein
MVNPAPEEAVTAAIMLLSNSLEDAMV